MSDYLSNYFNTTPEQLRRNAESVVQHAIYWAAEKYQRESQKHADVAGMDQEKWVITYTVAAAFIVSHHLDTLPLPLPEDAEFVDQLLEKIEESLTEWRADAMVHYLLCNDFYMHKVDCLKDDGTYEDCDEDELLEQGLIPFIENCNTMEFLVGAWMMHQLVGMTPYVDKPKEKVLMVQCLGKSVCRKFYNYWNGSNGAHADPDDEDLL